MEKVFASIITIGDELLIGQVIDTNSAWIAQALNEKGILLKHRVAVGDIREDIWQALDEESKQASLVIITGGLGPTADDITKPLLCEYFDGKMVVDQPTLEHLQQLFTQVLKRPMTERNAKQAEVPDTCTVLLNKSGTAPGMLFRKRDTVFIALPGVPVEMKWIMTNQVLPMLPSLFKTGSVQHRTLQTYGIGESYLADLIQDLETALPPHIKLAYLPNHGMVRLRLTGTSDNADSLRQELLAHADLLKARIQDYLVSDEDIPMEKIVGKLLLQYGKTVATAESCTGGYIAQLLSTHPGSSAFFWGSIVSYDNRIKEALLQVPASVLETAGAVSEATVRQMLKGVLAQIQTDYAVAVSGILGPDGGTPDKPVGTVWIAVGNATSIQAHQFHFRFDRLRNRELTAMNALNLLRIFILENH
ncbi:MAG TPA: competence/damage-inducible protein A [Sediminibacterium sp.]|nr:competence/damage-inducible protein A [Sediminibacterium sp.]